nr:hypothetical protein [Tanacetum cinerariifolium]
MLLDGSELTKKDRESQLYDDFEHFRQHKEESIHDYYVRNQATVQDGRVVVQNVQGRPNRGQGMNPWGGSTAGYGEAQNRVGNVNQGQARPGQARTVKCYNCNEIPSYDSDILSESTSSFTQLPPPRANSSSPADDLIENLTSTLALLTQSYITFLPQTNNQLRTSSNPRNQATVQDGRVVVQNVQGRPNRGQGMNPRGESAARYGEAQNRVGNVNQGQARPGQARTVKCYNCNGTCHIVRNCTQQKRPQNFEYFKDMMLLMQAQEIGVALNAEQLLFLAGGPDNAFDDEVDEQPV